MNERSLQVSYSLICFTCDAEYDVIVMLMTSMSCDSVCYMCGEAWSSRWLSWPMANTLACLPACVCTFIPPWDHTQSLRPAATCSGKMLRRGGIFNNDYCNVAFSALTLLVGRQEEHPACKNWVVRYWHGYLSFFSLLNKQQRASCGH